MGIYRLEDLERVKCDTCKHFVYDDPEAEGMHHHKNCPKYETEKFPHLFYWEDGVDAWIPTPNKTENMINAESHFSENDGDIIELRFKRLDLTDKEFDQIPVE